MSISVRLDDQTRAKPVLGGQIVSLRVCVAHLVGRGGLEPPTSRLSGVRSNHLSYRPAVRARRPPPLPAVRAAILGGAYRDRTDDPLLAKQMLSQLS